MTDPAPLKPQNVENREGLQFSMNDGSFAPGVEAHRRSGIVAIICLPGFWRLAAYQFCSAAGILLPLVYYRAPLASQVWQDNAASFTAWSNAVQASIGFVGAPQFGMWSDGRPRKISMTILASCQIARVVPLLILRSEWSLWVSVCINVITSPFTPRLTGSAVLWAWFSDTIPQDNREVAFSLMFSAGAFATWVVGSTVSAVATVFSLDPDIYPGIGMIFLVLALLLVVTSPAQAPYARDASSPNLVMRQQSFKDMMLSPFRLAFRKRSLRLVCGLAAFVTLPEIAVQEVATPIVFVMLGIDGPGNETKQALVAGWFGNFQNLGLIFVYATVGFCAARFGPARALAIWTPMCCVFFATPALLTLPALQGPPMEVLCGLMMCSPISIFPPLQALVAILVPPSRKGEAMGAVGGFQNLASLFAPLLMGLTTQMLANAGRTDLFWTLFPGASILMLIGAWPFGLRLAWLLRSEQESDLNQSDWSSDSGSVTPAVLN